MKRRSRDSSGRFKDLFFIAGLCFLCGVLGVVVGAWIADSNAYAGERVNAVGKVDANHKFPDVSGKDGREWIEGTRGWETNGNYLYPVAVSDSVGIGVIPTAKLDIDGLIRIRGGTPGASKVLTSDADGLASWATPSTSDPNAWKITGNAGTISGTNFIGTTDNQAFDIRTNNTLRTRITTKGQIETYNTGYSVFIGEGAGVSDDLSNNRNVFAGFRAGYSNTSGYYNTAMGYFALYSNTSGYYNTAMGYYALYSNSTGRQNTAVGFKALYLNTSGYYNTAMGYYALHYNTGRYNTATGYAALYNITTGRYNTAIGYWAGPGAGNGTLDNTIAVGYTAAPTASYQAKIGNSSMTSIGGYANWTNFSDGRFKKDVKETVPGLAFITRLRPVTYHFDMDKLETFLNTPDSLRDRKGEVRKARITYTGFIAQEVEEAANKVGYNFSGVDMPKNDKDLYGLRYSEFVVPLVKAVQEQQEMIEQLQKVVNEQQKQIKELKKR